MAEESQKLEYYFYNCLNDVMLGYYGDLPPSGIISGPPVTASFSINYKPAGKFNPPTIYIVSQTNETFADVSQQVYGDGDDGAEIAINNNLNPASNPPDGRSLLTHFLGSDAAVGAETAIDDLIEGRPLTAEDIAAQMIGTGAAELTESAFSYAISAYQTKHAANVQLENQIYHNWSKLDGAATPISVNF